MKQEYFVVVLAHSLRGRLRRIHVPHTAVYAVLCLAFLGCFSVFGFVASYARMVGKVANYNTLKREADTLRARYQNLQTVVNQKNDQLATLIDGPFGPVPARRMASSSRRSVPPSTHSIRDGTDHARWNYSSL